MALGKQIGEYSGQVVSSILGPGPGTALTGQLTMEGTVSGELGEGTYTLTHHVVYEPSMKSGPWSQYGIVNWATGTGHAFRNQGTWEETGSSQFRFRGTGQLSDGRTYANEFEGDMSTRKFTGKLYEWS